MHICINDFAEQQKLTHHGKSTIFQLEKKNRKSFWKTFVHTSVYTYQINTALYPSVVYKNLVLGFLSLLFIL